MVAHEKLPAEVSWTGGRCEHHPSLNGPDPSSPAVGRGLLPGRYADTWDSPLPPRGEERAVRGRKALREIPAKLMLLSASMVLTLALAETALWVFPGLLSEGARIKLHWQNQHYRAHVPDPYIGYLPAPLGTAGGDGPANADSSLQAKDYWGDRNKEPWPDEADIVVVGNSLAYGMPMSREDAWTTLLDHALPDLRVVTLGLIGASPEQYRRVYETFGIGLHPKVLLVCLFPGNDLTDVLVFKRWWESGREKTFAAFTEPEPKTTRGRWRRRIEGKSRLLTLVTDLKLSYRDGNVFGGKTLDLSSGERVQLVPRFLRAAALREEPGREEFRLAVEAIRETRRLAEQHGTKCVVVLFPTKEEVYLSAFEKDVPSLTIPFAAELEAAGALFLDLTPVFRERAADGAALFLEVDGHPNERGYALVTETVLAYLRDHSVELGLAAPSER
jgi:hypothetical protein